VPSTSSTNQDLINLQAAQLAAQVANWAAQLEFAKQRFSLLELPQFQHASQMDIDRLAFEKATQAWQQAFNEASLTGTYQGQDTKQWLTQQAQLTGVLNGSQTLQGKLTDAQVAQMNSAMKIAQDDQLLRQQQFGFQQTQWNAEFGLQKAAQTMQYMGYDPTTGQPTLASQAQSANITGYDLAGNPTLARQVQTSELMGYDPTTGAPTLGGRTGVGGMTGIDPVTGLPTLSGRTGVGGMLGIDPVTGLPTLAGRTGVGSMTGYDPVTGAPTLARQGQESSEAMALLQFLSGLRGPQNAFAQLRALGNVPGSMQDVANALLGRYQIGGTTGGTNPTPANMFSLFGYGAPGANMGGTTAAGAAAGAPVAPLAPLGPMTLPNYVFPTANAMGPVQSLVNPAPISGQAWDPGNVTPMYSGNVNPAGTPNAPGAPTPFIATPADTGPIPGRGMDPSTWNAATQAAVAQWNATHPGFQANGTQLGYGYVGPVLQNGGTLDFTQPIPGRGIPFASWNPATVQAVQAWNAAHPGFEADGSPAGYRLLSSGSGPTRPGVVTPMPPTSYPEPGSYAGPPTSYPEPGIPPAPASPPPQTATGGTSPAGQSTDSMAGAVAAQAYTSPAAQQAANPAAPAASTYNPTTPDVAPAVAAPAGETAAVVPPVISPPGTQAPPAMYNYTPTTTGAMQVHPPGAVADPQSYQFSTPTPASQQDQSSWLASVLPNQINAENYGNLNQYAQDVAWAGYEDIGWDPNAARDAFKKSLPRYGGPGGGSFAGLG